MKAALSRDRRQLLAKHDMTCQQRLQKLQKLQKLRQLAVAAVILHWSIMIVPGKICSSLLQCLNYYHFKAIQPCKSSGLCLNPYR